LILERLTYFDNSRGEYLFEFLEEEEEEGNLSFLIHGTATALLLLLQDIPI
jgi:hypothetical protein